MPQPEQRSASSFPPTIPYGTPRAAAGAAVLGADFHLLPAMKPDTVADLLAELRPEVVITHPHSDVHPDHRRACLAVLEALPLIVIPTEHPRRLYVCES